MSVGVDLVQLRWQHVRAMEAQRNTEIENIGLRQQLVELRLQLEHMSDEKRRLNIQSLVATFTKKLVETRRNMKDMANETLGAIDRTKVDMNILSTCFQNLSKTLASAEGETKRVWNQYNETLLDMEKLKREHAAARDKVSQGADKLNSEIARLAQDLESSEAARRALMHDHNLLKESFGALESSHLKLATKGERLESEHRALRSLVARLDTEKKTLAQEAEEALKFTHRDYENQIEDLKVELKRLHVIVEAQRLEIEQLKSSLIGNKSHFAKYVELKTENTALMDTIEKLKTGGAGAAVGRGVSGGTRTGPADRLQRRSKARELLLAALDDAGSVVDPSASPEAKSFTELKATSSAREAIASSSSSVSYNKIARESVVSNANNADGQIFINPAPLPPSSSPLTVMMQELEAAQTQLKQKRQQQEQQQNIKYRDDTNAFKAIPQPPPGTTRLSHITNVVLSSRKKGSASVSSGGQGSVLV